jgi:hypothetical protein
MNLYYLPSSGSVLRGDQLQINTGFSPDTDPGVLAANGIYLVQQTPNPCDPYLYSSEPTYTVVGIYAEQGWVATPLPLSYAKETGSQEVRVAAATQESNVVSSNGLTTDILTAVSGQDPLDRPARFQLILDEMGAVSDNLDASLTAIDSATSVDEINNIVNKPTGTLFTGRGGGLGPQDLNISYYTAFNSVSMTEADTELYVPGTDTVVPYGVPNPGEFDSLGNVFAVGDYLLQIREVATGMVIAEFECPLAPAGEDVSF